MADKKPSPKKLIILVSLLVGLVYLVFNLAILKDFGITHDERDNVWSGVVYLKYFTTGNEDYLKFSTDNPSFAGNEDKPLYNNPQYSILGFKFGHPPAANLMAAASNLIFQQKLGIMAEVSSYHLPIVILISILTAVFMALAVAEFGWLGGSMATAALVLFPFFFGHSHNNVKDLPMAVFFALSLICFYRGFRKNSLGFLLLYSLFFGLGLGIKPNMLFVPVILGIWLIFAARKAVIGWWIRLIALTVLGLVIVVLIWPYLWSDTLDNLRKTMEYFISNSNNREVYFWGKMWKMTPYAPWQYAPVYLALKTPPVILFFTAVGLISSIFSKTLRRGIVPLAAIWFAVTFGRVIIRPALWDGLRLFIEVVPAMAILTGAGFVWIYNGVKKWLVVKSLYLAAVAIALIWLLITNIIFHPYQATYFNSFIGGMKGAQKYFNVEDWGSAYRELALWANDNIPAGSQICIPFADHLPKFYLDPAKNYQYECVVNRDAAVKQYVMTIHRTGYYNEPYMTAKDLYPAIYSIKRGGAELAAIYLEEPDSD